MFCGRKNGIWRTSVLTVFLLGLVLVPWVSSAQEDKKNDGPIKTAAPQAEKEPLEPLKIELPEPFFGGTPLDYWGAHLEPESYKDRPPFLAPKGTTIVSRGKAVTSSIPPQLGDLKQVVDGDKEYGKSSLVELGPGTQWVQVDLGAEHEIYAILLWHFHEGKRVYFDVIVQASSDPEFKKDVTTLYNNDYDNTSGLGVGSDKEYIENNQGRLIDGKGVKARYIRCYSNGNTANDNNHYVEIEVWGRPVK